ncbi:MAG: glycosyltransferase [Planctomycetes bacterium]|nr:glycosyltransferase [Planctomycetota bacterium]
MSESKGSNDFTIMSLGEVFYVIVAYDEVVRSFESKGIRVRHIGISTDLWCSPENHIGVSNYESFGYDCYYLPRISGFRTSVWYTPDLTREFEDSLSSIRDFMDRLLYDFEPDVFLIADDMGIIEVFIMQYLESRKIPIVFVEHGPAFGCLSKEKFQIKERKAQDWVNRDYHLPCVNPIGCNGKYLICSFSDLLKQFQINYGVDPAIIRDTGFPYYDKVFEQKGKYVKTKTNGRKKVLIISDGRGKFHGDHITSAKIGYRFMIDTIKVLQNDYDVFLRLKPGEVLKSFLDSQILKELNDCKFDFDDNSVESYKAIQKYDLVMGKDSTVLLESIILGIPTILIRLENDPYVTVLKLSNGAMMKDIVGVLTISDVSELKESMKKAFSDGYVRVCTEKLIENYRYFFGKLDGKMSERVGAVIIEAIIRGSIEKGQFSQACNLLALAEKYPDCVELKKLKIDLLNDPKIKKQIGSQLQTKSTIDSLPGPHTPVRPSVTAHQDIYNSDFYKEHKDETLYSAKVIVPLILDIFPAGSVVDLGCGDGTWLSVFVDCGARTIRGFDVSDLAPYDYRVEKKYIETSCDFSSQEFVCTSKVDIVICLEVAEHLPEAAAPGLVKNLVNIAPVVIFSAAFPWQTSTHHINEQPHWYWQEKFHHYGYVEIDFLRPLLWSDGRVCWWYRQNITTFVSHDYLERNPKAKNLYSKYQELPEAKRLTVVSEGILKKQFSLIEKLTKDNRKQNSTLVQISQDRSEPCGETNQKAQISTPLTKIECSVIIPTYNRCASLGRAIGSLVNQDFEANQYEILVVDNGSTDSTRGVVESAVLNHNGHNIRYIYEPEPGLHCGRHRGAIESTGQILCYLDDDVVVDKLWLQGVIETFTNTDAVLVGGKILPKYETEPPEWINQFIAVRPEGKSLGQLSLIDFGNELKQIDPCFVWGCNYSIRKDVLFECGGFHPDSMPSDLIRYRGNGEIALSASIKEKGYKAYYNPKACVYHYIPKERLTVEYFCKRMFCQGISDSFAQIRKDGNIQNPITLKIRDAYNKGMAYHHEQVLSDPELLKWILKKEYFKSENSSIKAQLKQFENCSAEERQSFYDENRNYYEFKERLIELGVPVKDIEIDINDFEMWRKMNPTMENSYKRLGDAFIEKLLEHYLTYTLLEIKVGDVFIDVAASGSPWADILSERGIESYRLDLSYERGINGRDIGADASDTKLPDNFASVLTLHCAYECFMGDADRLFIKEAERILKNNGRFAIVPLYFDPIYLILTSPYCDQGEVIIDPGAKKVWRDDKYKAPFSRHYSPEVFVKRIYSKLNTLKGQLYFVNNIGEIQQAYPDQRVYCYFIFVGRKNGVSDRSATEKEASEELCAFRQNNLGYKNVPVPSRMGADRSDSRHIERVATINSGVQP